MKMSIEMYDATEEQVKDEKYHIQLGGDRSNPTWDEYFQQFYPEWQTYIEGIRECLLASDLMGKCANEIDNDNLHFVAEDGHTFAFSARAWGDLMQAIVGRREGYMAYYYKFAEETDAEDAN